MLSDATGLPRISFSVLFAALVTAALFLMMQDLIRHTGEVPDTVATIRFPDPGPVIEDLPIREILPPVPPPEVIPPPPTPVDRTVDPDNGLIGAEIPAPTLEPGYTPSNAGLPDGEILPIVKVTPVYPSRAVTRGIEGYVLLKFTVDETGAVVEPRIIESEPGNIFDQAALKAVLRFKYKPRVMNGQPVRVEGVLHRLTFELARA